MEGDVADRKCHTLHPIISIHSLRMEGDLRKKSVANWLIISIHSLRMEGDRPFLPDLHILIIFQSTPSAWRETSEHRCSSAVAPISIHSLRMEGDMPLHRAFMILLTFQSTPSAWRETETTLSRQGGLLFQSTPSAWRETRFQKSKKKAR